MNKEFKISEEIEEFLKTGTWVKTPNFEVFYMPFYFQKLENGNFNILQFDELPETLVDYIIKQREGIDD